MTPRTPSEEAQVRANEAGYYGRVAGRADAIPQLEALLSENDKSAVLAGLKQVRLGSDPLKFGEGFEEKDLPAIKEAIGEVIAQLREMNGEVAGLSTAIKKGIVKVGEPIAPVESTERLDERLKPLVVDAVNALPEGKRVVRGKIRTGEEVARAIPDVEAFLAEVALMQEGTFFELNERGQLVMKDGVKEAYGLKDDFPAAQTRQKRLVYRDDAGNRQVLADANFTVDKDTGDRVLPNNKGRIAAKSIIMERGLPTLTWDGSNHTGEYARMNDKGQFERQTYAWVEDGTITDDSRARYADWRGSFGLVDSYVNDSYDRADLLGSRGVLRVNLNLES